MSHIRVDKRHGFAHVVMAKEPVNSMDAEFWEKLGTTLNQLEKDPEVRGVIFSSGLKKEIFTAGNDIKELYMPNTTAERFTRFWLAQTNFLSSLYKSPLVTIAAIRGACPAGGCITALCCDVRVMTEDASSCIGLNEVQLGIAVPKFWAEVMARVVGHRVAEKLLNTAALPQAKEALKLGVVDHVVPQNLLINKAEEEMRGLLRFPSSAYAATKMQLRTELADKWAAFGPEEANQGIRDLNKKEIVVALGKVIQRLSGGQKSKL